jgi:ATP-dependent Clp protease protease subunit
MPIGVPRIIYCWGEELPAQWTDIYNFIFRRRMVFLMQYLDDELCNQICGLLINLHMEDRSKEMEKKEMESSGLFKSPISTKKETNLGQKKGLDTHAFSGSVIGNQKGKSIEDLMISEQDLAIDENYMLERHTLQKISLEWLNWNAQFFDYSDEPYVFYLAELLAKNFSNSDGSLLYTETSVDSEHSLRFSFEQSLKEKQKSSLNQTEIPQLMSMFQEMSHQIKETNSDLSSNSPFDVYSAFRLLSNFTSQKENYSYFQNDLEMKKSLTPFFSSFLTKSKQKNNISSIMEEMAQKTFFENFNTKQTQWNSSEKALTQRQLRQTYSQDHRLSKKNRVKPASYLNDSTEEAYMEYRDYYRKQTERTFQEEEAKKVFVIINSFGGSVGNGITVHDALQFIKAGSMTLALGVAASAASLVLAGGTIGERYVTEGCHTMLHQPESGLSGQASDIWIDSQEIMKIRLDVAEIYSLSTYRPRHKILRDLDRDFYLTATETIHYGLADEIATNEVMHEIIEMTSKVWDYHDSVQQRLLESRESANDNSVTQVQN